MTKTQDNQGLIEAAKSGDREAFETLVSQDCNRIRALVASRLNARIVFGVEVDDVYQEDDGPLGKHSGTQCELGKEDADESP